MNGESKPLLVLFGGVTWSGTKPLCETLHRCQKIAHHGLVHENNIYTIFTAYRLIQSKRNGILTKDTSIECNLR